MQIYKMLIRSVVTWIWNLDPYKIWWEFVKDLWKENTADDVRANPRGGICGELEIIKNWIDP